MRACSCAIATAALARWSLASTTARIFCAVMPGPSSEPPDMATATSPGDEGGAAPAAVSVGGDTSSGAVGGPPAPVGGGVVVVGAPSAGVSRGEDSPGADGGNKGGSVAAGATTVLTNSRPTS